jgi:hypothetical protein
MCACACVGSFAGRGMVRICEELLLLTLFDKLFPRALLALSSDKGAAVWESHYKWHLGIDSISVVFFRRFGNATTGRVINNFRSPAQIRNKSRVTY